MDMDHQWSSRRQAAQMSMGPSYRPNRKMILTVVGASPPAALFLLAAIYLSRHRRGVPLWARDGGNGASF